MFSFLKKKEEPKNVLVAPIAGEVIKSADIPDPTFAEEMLGKGLAIRPTEGKVYAPCDANVAMIFDTKHAISLVSTTGAEILIHVGLDTVTLKGEPFTVHTEAGKDVKQGDLLLEFDMDMIKAAGLETVSPVVICNSADYKSVDCKVGKVVAVGDPIIEIA